jgi:hypothetical protein
MATLKKNHVFVLELTDAEASTLYLAINATALQGLKEGEIALARAIEELLADRHES